MVFTATLTLPSGVATATLRALAPGADGFTQRSMAGPSLYWSLPPTTHVVLGREKVARTVAIEL